MDFFKSIPTHMDFKGQGRAEVICRWIISVFGVVGFLWGYCIQQISQTVYILGAGFILTALLTLPPWPMYRKHPLKWQSPIEEGAKTTRPTTGGSGKRSGGKKNK